MKGTILYFNENENKGQIAGHDGQRYSFVRMDFLKEGTIREGMEVEFVAEEGGAKSIYPVNSNYSGGTINNIFSGEELSQILAIACAIIPLLGIVLYFVWMHSYPKKAKTAGIISYMALLVYLLRRFWYIY